jgi:hypothetical protein
MLTANGKTGTAPGTTTIAFDGALGHDSGVLVYNAWGVQTPPLAGLDAALPTDFDRAGMLNYLPYLHGWLVGNLAGTPPATAAEVPADPLEMQRLLAFEQIKAHRSNRMWGAIAGLVGIGGLLVAIIALRK